MWYRTPRSGERAMQRMLQVLSKSGRIIKGQKVRSSFLLIKINFSPFLKLVFDRQTHHQPLSMCRYERMVWPGCRHESEGLITPCKVALQKGRACEWLQCQHEVVPHRNECPTCKDNGISTRNPDLKAYKFHAWMPRDGVEVKVGYLRE
jgi:hypothetical protein